MLSIAQATPLDRLAQGLECGQTPDSDWQEYLTDGFWTTNSPANFKGEFTQSVFFTVDNELSVMLWTFDEDTGAPHANKVWNWLVKKYGDPIDPLQNGLDVWLTPQNSAVILADSAFGPSVSIFCDLSDLSL